MKVVLPARFGDLSMFRDIPNHQEVFGCADTDQSLIVEINQYQTDVTDENAPSFFFEDLSQVTNAVGHELHDSGVISDEDAPLLQGIKKFFAMGDMLVSKGRDKSEAANMIQVYLIILRLENVTSDLLITFNVPRAFSDKSTVKGRPIMDYADAQTLIKNILKSFAIVDWKLFG